MNGSATRAKGRRGESAAINLLTERDWTVADLTCGKATEDLLAVDPQGRTWAVEVKNTMNILINHRGQAMIQAKARRLPWMLLSKISGTSSWLVQRQGMRPECWQAKKVEVVE